MLVAYEKPSDNFIESVKKGIENETSKAEQKIPLRRDIIF